jgi:hypothetical protein
MRRDMSSSHIESGIQADIAGLKTATSAKEIKETSVVSDLAHLSRTVQIPGLDDNITLQVEGIVEHGDQRGRLLGFPTANIAVPEHGIQNGVWAGTVRIGSDPRGPLYIAAVSIGRRPTYYAKGQRLLEANLLDFSGDLYGKRVLVTLYTRIRPQRRFAGTSELVDQIRRDVVRVRGWCIAAGQGDLLDERQSTSHGRSSTRASGRPYAIGHKRSSRGAAYADQVRKERAARRAVVISDAARELAQNGNLTHEAVAVQTGVPVGYLLWTFPSNESLLAVASVG